MKYLLPLLVLLAACQARPDAATVPAPSPYAGEEERAIKALSAEEIAGLKAGAGLGFAMAAELNHYPGPRHVLDLADELNLTDEQRAQTQQIFDAMQAEARRLGEQVVTAEAALDSLFASGEADAETVRTQTEQIGVLRGRLRFVHLDAHLQMRRLLTPRQVMHYDMVRGYSDGADHRHHQM